MKRATWEELGTIGVRVTSLVAVPCASLISLASAINGTLFAGIGWPAYITVMACWCTMHHLDNCDVGYVYHAVCEEDRE